MRFPPIDALLPHRPPMVLLRRVLDFDGETARCEARFDDGHPFARNGTVRSVVLIELMAQCAGVCTSLRALERGDPLTGGYLVGVRGVRFARPLLSAEEVLEVSARLTFDGGELGTFESMVRADGAEVASGTLSVYRKDQGGERR